MNFFYFRLAEYLEVILSKISDKALTFSNKIYIAFIFFFSFAIIADYFLNYIFGAGPEGEGYDLAINYRLTSPSPSDDIVILDIDERSLSLMSKDYGRWPWPREVYAETVASIESENPKSVIFNILITDPDKKNPEGDKILDEITTYTEKTVYPITRLSPENDNKSKLYVSKIPGAKVNENFEDKTVAVLLPFLPGMQKNMGISNLSSDQGSIKSYDLKYSEDEWNMKSLVGKAVEFFDQNKDIKEKLYLNWRNKSGDYKRISIGDYFLYLQGMNDNFNFSFENKHVIIGATAPGISSPKGTPISDYTDDNLILATALDDALNDTDIKLLPDWISVLITLLVIIITGYLFIIESEFDVDKVFLIMEIISAILMFGVINFSNYFIDLSPVLIFGIAFYAVVKIVDIAGRSSLYGSSNNLSSAIKSKNQSYCIIPFINSDFEKKNIKNSILNLQKKFNVSNVFYCNEQFESDKVSENLNMYSSFIIFSENTKEKLVQDTKKIFEDNNLKIFSAFDINKSSQIDDVKKEIAKNNLNQLIKLF